MKGLVGICVLGLVVVFGLGLGAFFYLTRPPLPLTETLPEPNGFQALVEVETEWQALPKPSVELGAEQLELQRTSRLALITTLRTGLAKESQMPLATVREVFHTPPAQTSKPVIVGLIEMAEAELAAGRSAEATQLWSDALRFSPARIKGGVAIHLMVGLAGEKRTLDSVTMHLDRLSAIDRRKLAATLRGVDALWEPVEVVFARDLSLGLEEVAPSQRLGQRLAVFWLGTLKKVQEKTTRNFQAAAFRRAVLIQELE